MVPIGLVIRQGLGLDVNVYGELAAQMLLGSTAPPALLAVHAAVSIALALPIAWCATRSRIAGWKWGVAWGIGGWLVLNTWLLPLAFGRPSPWASGANALWPSFVVHVVYGVVAGAMAAALLARRPARVGPVAR